MLPSILLNRLNRELGDLERDPPPGIMCFPVDDDITHLEAYIKGPPDSPYEKGTFRLEIRIPHDYPFNPPQIQFKTMIYHPNIDDAGRICADILKKGEHGGWKPALNLSTTLISLSALMGNPNPDDPLDAEIAQEYRLDNCLFLSKARELTLKYATGEQAKKDTTMQKQESKPGSSGAEMLDNLERNANRPKQKSKLSLSTKRRKAKSPNDLDSNSTPSSSQITGVDVDILDVKSNAPSENTESMACDDDRPVVLRVKSDPFPSNMATAFSDDVKPVVSEAKSDTPSDSAGHVDWDDDPVRDTETLNVKNSASSDITEGVISEGKPVEDADMQEIESCESSTNEDSVAHNNIEPVEEKSEAKFPSTLPISPEHSPSQQPVLSESSSQKANMPRSTSNKIMDSIPTGKENLDDTIRSQNNMQSMEQERFTLLDLAKKEVKKDKGKAVYKSPSVQSQDPYGASGGSRSNYEQSTMSASPTEYMVSCGWRSSFDSFSFEDPIDLTLDNDFIPKKRTIDSSKRNKLSLSKSKRQKSQSNASQP